MCQSQWGRHSCLPAPLPNPEASGSGRGHQASPSPLPGCSVLAGAGADVNAEGKNGGTALTFAIRLGHTKVVELLRQADATE